MPAVALEGDVCTGHGGYPSRDGVASSESISINGKRVHLVGDYWNTHKSGKSSHSSYLAAGWPTVHINGKEVGYVGAPIACGGTIATGSSNVFVGENE